MKRRLRALLGLAAGAVILSSAATVAAQEHPASPPAAMGEKWREYTHKRMDAHIHALHDILNIHPNQEAPFQAFVASMKPPEHGDHAHGDHAHGEHEPGDHHDVDRGPGEMAGLTTPQRLDHMAAKMAEHQAAFQRHAAAVKTFYAALNPEQQKAFDALGVIRHGHGGHEFGGRGPMGDGPHAMEGPDGPDGMGSSPPLPAE